MLESSEIFLRVAFMNLVGQTQNQVKSWLESVGESSYQFLISVS